MIQIKDGEWIAILGGAGSGKTTLAKAVKEIVPFSDIYSSDYRFIGDSNFRKNLLKEKGDAGFDSYRDAINQSSWWDWNAVYGDLCVLKRLKGQLDIPMYNRDTGIMGQKVYDRVDSLIYEGVMLPEILWPEFDRIYFLYATPYLRFARLMEKDKGRRAMTELASRFLICDYSEKIFYHNMFDKLDKLGKVTYIDALSGDIIARPTMDWPTYIPMEVSCI